jgi:hypothetical protein
MLKPYHGDAKTERTTLSPLPVVMRDGEEEFQVESVVSYRRHRGKPQYLIKWLGVASIVVNVGKRERLDPLRLCPQAFSRESGTQNLGKKGSCVRVTAGSPEPFCKEAVV